MCISINVFFLVKIGQLLWKLRQKIGVLACLYASLQCIIAQLPNKLNIPVSAWLWCVVAVEMSFFSSQLPRHSFILLTKSLCIIFNISMARQSTYRPNRQFDWRIHVGLHSARCRQWALQRDWCILLYRQTLQNCQIRVHVLFCYKDVNATVLQRCKCYNIE